MQCDKDQHDSGKIPAVRFNRRPPSLFHQQTIRNEEPREGASGALSPNLPEKKNGIRVQPLSPPIPEANNDKGWGITAEMRSQGKGRRGRFHRTSRKRRTGSVDCPSAKLKVSSTTTKVGHHGRNEEP